MYTYARLLEDMEYLAYCGLDVGVVGRSVLKNEIPYVHVGDYSGGQAIITGGIHARENITSLLVMRQAFRAAFCAKLIEGGVYFIPMLNPDGALLIEKGAKILLSKSSQNENLSVSPEILQKINGGKTDFSLWKANINGIDLNNNFDAKFGKGQGQKTAPAPHGYHGQHPFCQPESRALKDFSIKTKPQITLSYHALGQELYWNFFQKSEARDRAIAEKINESLGYKIIDSHMNSTGGYKDWCIEYLKIPALTVEIIAPTHTHPLSDIDPDWAQNKDIPYKLAEIATGLANEND